MHGDVSLCLEREAMHFKIKFKSAVREQGFGAFTGFMASVPKLAALGRKIYIFLWPKAATRDLVSSQKARNPRNCMLSTLFWRTPSLSNVSQGGDEGQALGWIDTGIQSIHNLWPTISPFSYNDFNVISCMVFPASTSICSFGASLGVDPDRMAGLTESGEISLLCI